MERTATSADSAAPTFLSEALAGLTKPRKTLPCKYFYDARGSQLFEEICGLDEYYPTRTELGIMEEHVDGMADAVGPDVRLVELGAGSGRKTRLLLDALDGPAAYLPVEISQAALDGCARRLREAFPDLEVLSVCADYTRRVDLPRPQTAYEGTAAYFPGSTIGNFEPDEARTFLNRVARLVGEGGGLLIGVDLQKERDVLEDAYNDARGVTAAFNLNLLERINRELDGDFDLDAFHHRARWNPDEGRIEMHLVSRRPQQVNLADEAIDFDEGEYITTEYSYKYTEESFEALAQSAGFEAKQVWTDDREWFSVWYLEA
ncbi:L-histidine N(alpha)-methyltransferase [Persicimonas caeni]|uniref:L-histidine N(Alpha)-methyltransferase n=1 Tax=Persicimonas caeni TaxID=2292766 RepID=A0A4Y6PXX8_PERCE|nr:L-histidine N(alpha)-methyltransferase [Persicimonas caeni]QDG52847.1 L-histidine N(alpha)-methyltransferase [Persicimonas caeni]QED34069.1 L-histidine N(alpha)-methyltransferase [Persicimonas caeni]